MSDHNTLAGRTALVTGATSGIGRAVARTLAERGATVILHGRDIERGNTVSEQIRAHGGAASFVAADLTSADDVSELVAESDEVDILVNCAGIYEFRPTSATDVAAFDRTVAVNLRAPFLLVHALAPRMAERGSGAIVLIGSESARTPAAVGAAYGASKAGVEILARYWASEFGPAGVRVNAISPGAVHTEGTAAMLGENSAVLDRINARGRAGDPAEIAEIAAFLVSSASSLVNGAVIVADGGPRSAR